MKQLKIIPIMAFAALLVTSCNTSPTSTEEKTEIQTMDSTSKVAEVQTKKLEDQTKKVEASLENLDKEFDDKK